MGGIKALFNKECQDIFKMCQNISPHDGGLLTKGDFDECYERNTSGGVADRRRDLSGDSGACFAAVELAGPDLLLLAAARLSRHSVLACIRPTVAHDVAARSNLPSPAHQQRDQEIKARSGRAARNSLGNGREETFSSCVCLRMGRL